MAKSFTNNDGFIQLTLPRDAYELKILIIEFERIISEQGHFTESNYPFKIKTNFSTLVSIVEFFRQEPIISFIHDDSIRDLLGFKASTKNEEYNL